jgi:uncharacterized protein
MARSGADFRARYGPWAVVAGASEGLGAEYAAQLAARGLDLFLIARRRELLESLATKLAERHGVQVRTLAHDLAHEDAASVVAAETADLDIGLLVYNAALSVIGPFLERPLEEHVTEVMVNCRAPLTLAYTLGRRMLARGRGGIILMSSLSATMGSALIANYAATKAYNLVLAEGLWDERARGVDVMACSAGAVATANYEASAPKGGGGSAMPPRRVVAETLAALGKHPSFIPGRGNRLADFALRRLLPRRATIVIMGRVTRGMYGG